MQTGTLSSALPTIAEGPSDGKCHNYGQYTVKHTPTIHTEETDHMPTTDQKKDLTIDQLGDFVADGSHDDKKRQKRHKHKSKRKQLDKVTAPPPLRPRSRPTSQQSGTRSEGVSSVGGMAEGLNASKLNETQDTQIVKISTDNKEDTKNNSDSIGQHDIIHDSEQVTIVEEIPATGDDKVDKGDNTDPIATTDDDKETEATAE